MTSPDPAAVERHYAASARQDAILEAVRAAVPDCPCRIEDLAPLDQFHMRGAEATRELAALVGMASDMDVLDVGCGIGGPARYLAATFGCHVTGIDLSAEYCRIADALTALTGLGDKVAFRAGDACAPPFGDATFDLAWTQHAVMNIADRARLYAEIHRVLRPGGRFAMFDAVIGDGGPLHFPVPWATSAANSSLLTPDASRIMLERTGFEVLEWRDTTPATLIWLAARRGAAAVPPTLGLHLLLGPDFAVMAQNYGRNLVEGHVGLLMAVVRKTGG